MRRIALVAVVFVLLVAAASGRSQPDDGQIYWIDAASRRIFRAPLAGGTPQLVTAPGYSFDLLRGLAVDAVHGRIAFGIRPNGGYGTLGLADLNGGGVVVRTDYQPTVTLWVNAVEFDEAAGYVYWTDPVHDQIVRAALDGDNPEIVVVTGKVLREPTSLTWDAARGRLYWFGRGALLSAEPGSPGVQVLPGASFGETAALGPGGRLYWWMLSNFMEPYELWSVLPVAPDGQPETHFSAGTARPYGLAFDALGRAFWTQGAEVLRADLDGGNRALLATGSAPHAVALSADGGQVYWTDWAAQSVNRVAEDGGEPVPLVSTGALRPRGLVVDEAAGRLVWGGDGEGQLWAAPLAGGPATPFVGGAGETAGLALDAAGRRLFWVNYTDGRVWTAAAEGAGARVLLGGDYPDPAGLALDRVNGTLYWSDATTNAIGRVRLGSGVMEPVITTGLDKPTGLAVDPVGGKLYWADWGTRQIGRANLDGTQPEVLLDAADGLLLPNRVALDTRDGKLYWSDFGAGRIGRANLDGTEPEILVNEAGEIDGLALDRRPVGAYRAVLPLTISR